MDSDQQALFDAAQYDDGRTKRKVGVRRTNASAVAEERVEPWLLLTNRAGKTGDHLPQIADNGYGTTVARCGFVGRPVVPQPGQMVRCAACEK
jgi:hypothetical protein